MPSPPVVLLVFCYQCDAIQVADVVERNGEEEVTCSTCHSPFVEAVTEESLQGARDELRDPRQSPQQPQHPPPPPPRANATGRAAPAPDHHGGGTVRSRVSAYFQNFRRWAQEARAQRERRATANDIRSFQAWLSALANDNANDNDNDNDSGDYSEGDDEDYGRRAALPRYCRDFTTDEILSTQMVLHHGIPDEETHARLQREGEACVAALNEVAQAREERVAQEALARQQQGSAAAVADRLPPPQYAGAFASDEPLLPCSICLGEMVADNTDAAVVLHCGHFFHYKCLFEWVDLDNFSCPLCRKMIIEE